MVSGATPNRSLSCHLQLRRPLRLPLARGSPLCKRISREVSLARGKFRMNILVLESSTGISVTADHMLAVIAGGPWEVGETASLCPVAAYTLTMQNLGCSTDRSAWWVQRLVS